MFLIFVHTQFQAQTSTLYWREMYGKMRNKFDIQLQR